MDIYNLNSLMVTNFAYIAQYNSSFDIDHNLKGFCNKMLDYKKQTGSNIEAFAKISEDLNVFVIGASPCINYTNVSKIMLFH